MVNNKCFNYYFERDGYDFLSNLYFVYLVILKQNYDKSDVIP